MTGLTDAERGERVAPWLVMLSQHMPEIDEIGGVTSLGCSCGATRTLYVGHIARVLADTHERILAAIERDGLAAGVRKLADEMAQDNPQHTQWWWAKELRALLDAVPDARSPLPERVDAVIRRSRNLREGLVEAIRSGELAP